MSRKISDFFKTKPSSSNQIGLNKEKLERKNENLSTEDQNPFNIRNCRVVLKDISKKIQVSNSTINKNQESESKISKNIKHESEKDFDIILAPKINLESPKKPASNKKGKRDVKCKFCNRICQYTYLSRHMIAVHGEKLKSKLHECKICGLKLFMKKRFEQHMELKHSDGKIKYFVCDFDGKTFESKGLLHGHMKIHFSTIRCKICNKFIKPVNMAGHLSITHSTAENYQCDICSKNFKSSAYLRTHKQSHDKKFECKICSRQFQWATNLSAHTIDYHDNPMSFGCEICGKKFNTNYALKIHQKSHDKNRPKRFKCQRCEFSVDIFTKFKRHQQSHVYKDNRIAAMKNSLKCQICSALCRDSQILRQHIKYVHPKELVQCDLCGIFSKSKDNLKKHIKNHIRKNEANNLLKD